MLAFFSEWFGWMLHSWVPNNVLAFQRERGCFTSANALVNSLAWCIGIMGILETFSVSGTAY